VLILKLKMYSVRISKNSLVVNKFIERKKKKKNDTRLNFKKLKKGRIRKLEFLKSRLKIVFGTQALRVLSSGRIFAPHLETVRRILFRKAGRRLRFWNRSTLVYYLTAKSIAIRMGRGKGNLVHVISRISGGAVLVEFSGLSFEQSFEIKKNLLNKLYMPSELVLRQQYL